MEEFVRNDLFNILTDCKAHCSPLPALVRQGYCHQDLSVAHSCTKELLEQLNRYHQIDESAILARTLGLAINNCYHSKTEIPEWLLTVLCMPVAGNQQDSLLHPAGYWYKSVSEVHRAV